jgi:hypothetical protein
MMRHGTLSSAIPTVILALILGVAFPNLNCLPPERFQPQNGVFATPLTDGALDNASFADWVDGAEHPIGNPAPFRQVIWTLTTTPSTYYFANWGASLHPGVRHLRLGFTTPIAVGTVLVRGGGQLSVLRPNAPYPGNLADDSQWIPAQRIPAGPAGRQLSTAEVAPNGFALWVLPPDTRTRALRFTHTAEPTDASFAGTLGSLYLLSGRFANLAPQASVFTSANPAAASALHDDTYNGNHAWDNGPDFDHPVSAAHPEWITLVWPHPVALRGLAALMAGFNAADAEIFAGPDNIPVRDAPAADWQPVGQPYALRNEYPINLAVDWLDFGRTVQTRAVRLRLTQATNEDRSPQLKGFTHNGNRVWLDELMAIAPLPSAGLQAAILPQSGAANSAPHPPIPIHFALSAPGYVSLVIDDAQGNRVRNLVSDTLFPAGQNTAWWDGSDDLSRDREAADHGEFYIPTHFVAPGEYRVRGIVHQPIDLRYEFSVYSPGNPPWETLDGTGGWLTNHTPPSAALFLPADKSPTGKPLVYIGCYVAEGGSGLAWFDLEGNKQGGRGSVGGTWTAAQILARDEGPQANPAIFAYAAATWGDERAQGQALTKAILRLTGLSKAGSFADKAILSYTFDLGQQPPDQPTARGIWKQQIGGLAVRNNIAIVSLEMQNKLLFADTMSGKILATFPMESPRGLAFDAQGNLLLLSGDRLLRFPTPDLPHPQQLPSPQVLVAQGLDSPSGIVLDAGGTIFVSDQGSSNQVKVFSPTGKFLRAIGHPGPSKAGPYDPLHMNSPRGLAIDSNRHLWVAEEDLQPKRVSIWTIDGESAGTLVKAFYGPSEYGGGGSLDPTDKSKFYYHSMEFKLDWKSGTSTLASVLRRDSDGEFALPRFGTPESVDYAHGHRYFDNTWLAYPSNGVAVAMLYLDTGGLIRPVSALGRANDWSVLKDQTFAPFWPPNTNPNSNQPKDQLLFTWSDLNGNGKVDPEEVQFLPAKTGYGAVTVMPDLAIIDEFVNGKTMRYAPVKFTPAGVPVYDIHAGETLVDGAQAMSADGGGQVIATPVGGSPSEIVLTTAPAPFSRDGLGGVDSHGHRWSYPSLWPGLHPSHSAPVPDHPGELEGTTRLLGDFVHPPGTDAGPLWAINSNLGSMYLFTADGFFVTQLFQDVRVGKPWNVPVAQREMRLNDLTPHDENFFPSMTQTPDGQVYIVDGNHVAIVRVDGLNTIHRLPESTLAIAKTDIDAAQSYLKQAEAERQSQLGPQTLDVAIVPGSAPTLDGALETLKAGPWATIDQRIVKLGWADRPDLAKAAIAVAGGRLYAAFRTAEPNLLVNSGAVANAPFKTGGALDLMVGADSHADPARKTPVAGDVRLLVYRVNGQTKAMLYRAVVTGTRNPVPFSSPWRTITLDQVQDVTGLVDFKALSGADAGTYLFSIPLETLGLKPAPGERIKADIGILRGSPVETLQRVYWSNKATGITSDVPSEAELTPNLWGEWIFKAAP